MIKDELKGQEMRVIESFVPRFIEKGL